MGDDRQRGYRGDGSIRERKDGRVEKRLSLGVGPDGKRIRKSVYGRNLKELHANVRDALRQHRAGLLAAEKREGTLVTFMEDEHAGWLALKERELAPRTQANYWSDWKSYIRPDLGELRLAPEVLTVERVTRWHADIARAHGAYTANRARDLLRNALRDSPLKAQNPAAVVRPARHAKPPVEILTATELAAFIPATSRSRLKNLFLLALMTGLRHGEATALHWADVTLYRAPKDGQDHGELHVRRAVVATDAGLAIAPMPKSESGFRTIGLTPEAAAALRDQKALLAVEGNDGSSLVFPSGSGGLQPVENTGRSLRGVLDACNPRLVEWLHERRREHRERGASALDARRRAWKEAQELPHFADLLDVKRVSFHDLRHTFASMMIAAGMDAPTLARVLGHSDAAFTMRTYVHFFERAKRKPMPRIAALVPSFTEIGGQDRGSSPEPDASKEEARSETSS